MRVEPRGWPKFRRECSQPERGGAQISLSDGDEPYEPRGSRTDLWGTGGAIPPVYPALIGHVRFERERLP